MNGLLRMHVGVLKIWLCVFSKLSYLGIGIWVMREYEVKESWVELCTILNKLLSYTYVRPLGMKSGSKLLLEVFKTLDYQTNDHETRLVWYDIEKETTENVVIYGLRNKCFDSIICLNSLVSLAPYVGMDDRKPLKWVSVDEIKKHKQEIK